LVRAGTLRFKETSNLKNNARFHVKPHTESNFVFTGIELTSGSTQKTLSQKILIERLQFLPSTANFVDLRAKLSWASYIRPDISFPVSKLAQTTSSTFVKVSVKLANKIFHHLKASSSITIRYTQLDKSSLRILAYTSLHNNKDLSSQLGYVLLLADVTGTCCVLSFRSFESRRIARSSLAAETMAFADTFDASFALKHDLESMIGNPIPLLLLTDIRPLFDILVCAKYTTEKRLMIEIAAAREGFNGRDITKVCLIGSEHHIVDAMTKLSSNSAPASGDPPRETPHRAVRA
jgi:hypothetical protein